MQGAALFTSASLAHFRPEQGQPGANNADLQLAILHRLDGVERSVQALQQQVLLQGVQPNHCLALLALTSMLSSNHVSGLYICW